MASSSDEQRDLENGDPSRENQSFETADNVDEYTGLIRYVSTYRDPELKATADAEVSVDLEEAAPWYAPWRQWRVRRAMLGKGQFVVPDSWFTTDIKLGLSSVEVENRRKKVGWNELYAEKENMLLKFLEYFKGPILYDEYSYFSHSNVQ
ncbi:hypothetical protein V1520DRAFT_281781 [Lipomyces starkeyi]|uniref:Cation-transporting P-type ATPase N-terminal domain-containing protein n=1 Tax=Lipomyces starkeyi NRRL Y-11557 TaxID=675824 RepID=A0A1E3Q598_LIPST|nr:hypothetical protein LIPSTDRAFT_3231 [Lipomyces starkeyi NRRL Y-11557]